MECIHIAGIICGVGTAALVNFRLLGVGLTRNSARRLWREAAPWTAGGLFLAICSGLLLFSIDPRLYFDNYAFRFKMACLVAAIVFYYTLVRKAAASDAAGVRARIVACISLGLWALVPFGGIFIGSIGARYPVLLLLHVLALVCLGGMIVVTDLRLLGAGMRSYPAADIVNGLRVPKRIAFVAAAICGVWMFEAQAGRYLRDRWFWVKLALLALIAVHCLAFRRSVYDGAAKRPGRAKAAACLSLLLWAGAAVAARGPATVKDIMHSMVDPAGDFLFQSVQTIADEHGVREKAPRTAAQWEDVRERLMVLVEAQNLLAAQGRMAARPRDRSKNPEVENEPEEVQKLIDSDRPDFIRRAHRLGDAASVAMRAVEAQDRDALVVGLDRIDKACESCHLRYWYPRDKRAQEAAKEDGIVE